MIVVDNNALSGLAIPGDAYHQAASKARRQDADWHAPELCRSEFRSVATGCLRKGEPIEHVLAAAAVADGAARFYRMEPQEVFAVVQESPLSAYDAEFVALARRLGCPLVTTDKQILKYYPNVAVRLTDFIAVS